MTEDRRTALKAVVSRVGRTLDLPMPTVPVSPSDVRTLAIGCSELLADAGTPIDVVLLCPVCGYKHIDAPEPPRCPDGVETATGVFDPAGYNHDDCAGCGCPQSAHIVVWNNPPHKSHLCHHCRTVWRPADVPTNGVESAATRGEHDTWPAPQSSPPNETTA